MVGWEVGGECRMGGMRGAGGSAASAARRTAAVAPRTRGAREPDGGGGGGPGRAGEEGPLQRWARALHVPNADPQH